MAKHTEKDRRERLTPDPIGPFPTPIGAQAQLASAVQNLPQGAPGQTLGTDPAGTDQGGFLSSLLSILTNPSLLKGVGAFGAGVTGQGQQFIQNQAQNRQRTAELDLAKRREAREFKSSEEALLTSQQVRRGKDRTAAMGRVKEIASLPNSTYDDISPDDQQFVSPKVFQAFQNRSAITRIDQIDKLGGLLARNPEAVLPKSLQGAFTPDGITIARDTAKEAREIQALSVRETKSKIVNNLSQTLGAGQLTETTDLDTGEITRSEQVPFQPRQETAQQAENRFREEIAERFEKGEISKDMLNFLAGGKFGNSTKEELDIISLASVLAEVRGIKSKAGILEDMRTIVASVDPELAKKIPEMFVESESSILGIDKTKLRIPSEGVEQPDVEQPKAARKVGDRVNTPKGPAVITAINEDGTIEVEFE